MGTRARWCCSMGTSARWTNGAERRAELRGGDEEGDGRVAVVRWVCVWVKRGRAVWVRLARTVRPGYGMRYYVASYGLYLYSVHKIYSVVMLTLVHICTHLELQHFD